MAFGVKREELRTWKRNVRKGNIAILTHFWLDERFPGCDTVTKVGCVNMDKLKEWGRNYGLAPEQIHKDPRYPHFDLFGKRQLQILKEEGCWEQIHRFRLDKK